MGRLIACAIGFQHALGALDPPEVSVHLDWLGRIYVNGAGCGRLRVAAAHSKAGDVPNWIVVGLEISLIPQDLDSPGSNPDQTCLYEEGCGDVLPQDLVGAWVRHCLVWINRMQDERLKPLNSEWRGLATEIGHEVSWDIHGKTHTGVFVGVDENFGAILRRPSKTADNQMLSLKHLTGRTR